MDGDAKEESCRQRRRKVPGGGRSRDEEEDTCAPWDPCKSFQLPFCTERLVVEFSLVTQGHAFAVSVDDGELIPIMVVQYLGSVCSRQFTMGEECAVLEVKTYPSEGTV